MKSLVSNTAVISITEAFMMLLAIGRNKYLAISIGPVGLGIYGLITTFFGMISIFAGTWIGSSATKYIAEYNTETTKEIKNQIFTFSLLITTALGILIVGVLLLFRSFFMKEFLSEEVLEIYYILFVAGFIGMNIRPVLASVLQGLLQIKIIVKSRIIITIFDLLMVIFLVSFFHLLGFFISILVSSLFAVFILLLLTLKKGGITFSRIIFSGQIIKKLMSFGSINLLLNFVNFGSLYIQRLIIVQYLGIFSVGIFQAGVGVMNYLGIVNKGSLFHFFPAMSKKMDNSSRIQQINEYLFFILLITIPMSSFIIIFGNILIQVLYSKEFLILSNSLYLFVIAQVITILMTTFQTTVFGMAKLKLHTIAVFVIHTGWVIIPFLLIKTIGFYSLPIGIAIGQLIGGLIYIIHLRRSIDLKISKRVSLLIIFLSVVLLTSIIIRNISITWQILIYICVFISPVAFLNTKERSAAILFLGNFAQRVKNKRSGN